MSLLFSNKFGTGRIGSQTITDAIDNYVAPVVLPTTFFVPSSYVLRLNPYTSNGTVVPTQDDQKLNTIANSGTGIFQDSKMGPVFSFNGGSLMTVTGFTTANSGFTRAFWVYPTSITTGVLFSSTNVSITFSSNSVRFVVGSSPALTYAAVLNTWVHYAFTYDTSKMTLYANGLSVATQSYTGSNFSDTTHTIGGSTSYFSGYGFNYYQWNTALTYSSIYSLWGDAYYSSFTFGTKVTPWTAGLANANCIAVSGINGNFIYAVIGTYLPAGQPGYTYFSRYTISTTSWSNFALTTSSANVAYTCIRLTSDGSRLVACGVSAGSAIYFQTWGTSNYGAATTVTGPSGISGWYDIALTSDGSRVIMHTYPGLGGGGGGIYFTTWTGSTYSTTWTQVSLSYTFTSITYNVLGVGVSPDGLLLGCWLHTTSTPAIAFYTGTWNGSNYANIKVINDVRMSDVLVTYSSGIASVNITSDKTTIYTKSVIGNYDANATSVFYSRLNTDTNNYGLWSKVSSFANIGDAAFGRGNQMTLSADGKTIYYVTNGGTLGYATKPL
jgi:hypothetical protein